MCIRDRDLPESRVIEVGEGAPSNEPMWFYIAFGARPDAAAGATREPLEHKAGFREITGLTIHGPADRLPSDPARVAHGGGIVSLVRTADHLMEVEFDGAAQGQNVGFQPWLPFVSRW